MDPRAKYIIRAWDFLRYEIAPDIALVQDALPPSKLGDKEQFIYPTPGEIKGHPGASGIWKRDSYSLNRLEIDTAFKRRLIGAEVGLSKGPYSLFVISMYRRNYHRSEVTSILHSMISDLHHLLVSHRERIVLSGDWYIDPRHNKRYPYISPLHRLVFDRLEDRYYGLKRCNKNPFPTFYHSSGCSYQNDYIFSQRVTPS